jgi:cytosine/adenosine deaminase-related metal-dependent hydrolase
MKLGLAAVRTFLAFARMSMVSAGQEGGAMRPVKVSAFCLLLLVVSWSAITAGQSAAAGGALLFEGARLIVGDGSTIEDSAFLVENTRFTRVGPRGEIQPPTGAPRVDLTGKTVMPAIIDAHGHLGYSNVRTNTNAWENYTRENLIETLQRFAYYGVGTAMAMGNDGGHGDLPWKLRDEVIANAARFRSAGGALSQPGEGHMGVREPSWYHVTNETDARKAIQDLAPHKPDLVKILVDDRLGEIPSSMPPAIYKAIFDEAHKHNLRVAAHMFSLKDTTVLLRG